MTYEQNLLKEVNQKEEKIDDPENSSADNVLKHISIVKAFVQLVNEKIAIYKRSMMKLAGDIKGMDK